MEELGDAKRQVDRLATVQTGVTDGFVAGFEVGMTKIIATTKTFRDVFAGQFDVNAARPGADFVVSGEESFDLAADVVEMAGLAAGFAGEGVAVHRVTGPHDRMIGVFDRL